MGLLSDLEKSISGAEAKSTSLMKTLEASTTTPEVDEATWGELLTAYPTVYWDEAKKTAAGGLIATGDFLGDEKLRQSGEDLFKQADESTKAAMPTLKEGSFKDMAFGAALSTGQMLPLLVVGAASGGVTAPLVGIGATTGLRQYGEYRTQDIEAGKAAVGAAIYGGSEALSELIPGLKLLKRGTPFLKRLIETSISEVYSENINQIVQDATDFFMKNSNATLGDFYRQHEFLKTAYRTTGTTLMQSLFMTAGMHPLVKRGQVHPGKEQVTDEVIRDILGKTKATGDAARTAAEEIVRERANNAILDERSDTAATELSAHIQERKKKKFEKKEAVKISETGKALSALETILAPEAEATPTVITPTETVIIPTEVVTPTETVITPTEPAIPALDLLFKGISIPTDVNAATVETAKKHARPTQEPSERLQRFFYNDMKREVQQTAGRKGVALFSAEYAKSLEAKKSVVDATISAYDAFIKSQASVGPTAEKATESIEVTADSIFTRPQYDLAWQRANELGTFSINSLWNEFRGLKQPEGRMGRKTIRSIIEAWIKEGRLTPELKFDEPTGRWRTAEAQIAYEAEHPKVKLEIKVEERLQPKLETEAVVEPATEFDRYYAAMDKPTISHIITMSKRRKKDVDFFLKESPDSGGIKAALTEAGVPDNDFRDFLLFIKQRHNVMTLADELELMNSESLRALDAEFEAINNEDITEDLEVAEEDANLSEDTETIKDSLINDIETVTTEAEKTDIETEPVLAEEEQIPEKDRPYDPLTSKETPALEAVKKNLWYQTQEEAIKTSGAIATAMKARPEGKTDDPMLALQYIMANINKDFHKGVLNKKTFAALEGLSKQIDANRNFYRTSMDSMEFNDLIDRRNEASRYVATISAAILERVSQSPTRIDLGALIYEPIASKVAAFDLLRQYERMRGVPSNAYDMLMAHKKIYEQHRLLATDNSLIVMNAILARPELVSTLRRIPVELHPPESPDPNLNVAGYYSDRNTISVNLGNVALGIGDGSLHEVVHALTLHALRTNPAFKEAIDKIRKAALRTVHPDVQRLIQMSVDTNAFLYTVNSLRDVNPALYDLADGKDYAFHYGLVNVEEFVATSLSHGGTQIRLSAVAYPGRPSESLLSHLKAFITKFICGENPTEEQYNAFQAVIDVTGEFLDNFDAFTADKYYRTYLSQISQNPPVVGAVVQQLSNPLKYRTKSEDTEFTLAGSGEQKVIIPGRKPDANLLFDAKLSSPEFVAVRLNDPEAADVFARGIDSYDLYLAKSRLAMMEFERLKSSVGDAAEAATKVAMQVEAGKSLDSIQASAKVKDAAKLFLDTFNRYKIRYRDFQRIQLLESMNTTEREVFRDTLINGKSILETLKTANRQAREFNKRAKKAGSKERIGTASQAVMQSYFTQWNEIKDWGIEDYVTHAMKGSIAIVTEEIDPESGKTTSRLLSVAETRQQAVQRAMRILEDNPSLDTLYIDTTHWFGDEPSVKLSKGQYWSLKSRMAAELKREAGVLEADIREAMTNKMLKKLVAIKPSPVWNPFLQERKEILPGEESLLNVLPTYFNMMEKKMAIDPFIRHFRKVVDRFSNRPVLQQMMYEQVESIRGKYGQGDKIADNMLASLGMDTKFAWTRTAAEVRNLLANLKLGYRPVASLINLMSGMGHTWTKTGAKYIYKAYQMLQTPEGKAFIDQYAPALGVSFAEKEAGIATRTPWWQPLGLFQAAELPNRSVCLIANYLYGKEMYNYNEGEAIEFAKRSVRIQQFDYSVAALPQIMRGPTGKILTQFKPYLVKEIEFIRSLKSPSEWAKYLFMQTFLGGPRGFMTTLKSLPFLALIKGDDWLDSIEQWMNIKYPKFTRGVFGYFGIDASGPASFQFPQSIEDWMGITVSELVRLYKDIYVPLSNGESYIGEDIKKFLKGSVPVFKLWADLIESRYHEGWIWDDKGNKKYEVEDWTDVAKMLGGFKPLKQSVQDVEIRLTLRQEQQEKAQADKIVRQFVKSRYRLNVEKVVEELVQEAAVHTIQPTSIVEAIKKSELDPSLKQIISLKVVRRAELWRRRAPTVE